MHVNKPKGMKIPASLSDRQRGSYVNGYNEGLNKSQRACSMSAAVDALSENNLPAVTEYTAYRAFILGYVDGILKGVTA